MKNNEYNQYIAKKQPNSPIIKNCVLAFLFGGAICTMGEVINNLYLFMNMTKDDAGMLTSITLIFLGVVLTGMGWYSKLAKHAGAGTIVPITGFANSVAAPAIEAKTEGYILGVAAKIFTIAGPVIVYGTLASVIVGIIFCIFML